MLLTNGLGCRANHCMRLYLRAIVIPLKKHGTIDDGGCWLRGMLLLRNMSKTLLRGPSI